MGDSFGGQQIEPGRDGHVGSVLGYWFTAPSARTCDDLGALLTSIGLEVREVWNPLPAGMPQMRPWCLVADGPPTHDPTVISALALSVDARYHPDGGVGRWL